MYNCTASVKQLAELGPDAGLTLTDQFTHETHLFVKALEGEAATLIVSSHTTDDVHPA